MKGTIDHEIFVARMSFVNDRLNEDSLKNLFFYYEEQNSDFTIEEVEVKLMDWEWYEDGQEWYRENKDTSVLDDVLDHDSSECESPCPVEKGEGYHPDEIDGDAVEYLASGEVLVEGGYKHPYGSGILIK